MSVDKAEPMNNIIISYKERGPFLHYYVECHSITVSDDSIECTHKDRYDKDFIFTIETTEEERIKTMREYILSLKQDNMYFEMRQRRGCNLQFNDNFTYEILEYCDDWGSADEMLLINSEEHNTQDYDMILL